MKKVLIISVLLCGMILAGAVLFSPLKALVQDAGGISKIAVTFYGDTTTAKGFSWYTSNSSRHSDLQVMETSSGKADFSGSGVMSFTGTSAIPTNKKSTTLNGAQEELHKAQAAGLKAGTKYYFRLGDASLNLWSKTGTFKTSAPGGAFTFLDLSDPQASEPIEAKLAANTFKAAVKTVPDADFIALNGDIVDDGSAEHEWDWLFNDMSGVMQNYTFAPIAGNHDSKVNSFIEHFDILPASGSATATGAYYSFDYSNAHFVMLNTNENSATYSDLSVNQVNWMKGDIAAAKAQGRWVVVLMHKGPYTTSGHATDSDIQGAAGVRNMIAPVFAKLRVDLVLQGHDHIYARSKPIKADGTAAAENIITDTYNGQTVNYQVNPDGSVYLIPATAGPKVYYKNTSEPQSYFDLFDVADQSHAAVYGNDTADGTRPMRSMVDNFESISIDGGRLTVISYEIDHGGMINPTEDPYVVDAFGIIKK